MTALIFDSVVSMAVVWKLRLAKVILFCEAQSLDNVPWIINTKTPNIWRKMMKYHKTSQHQTAGENQIELLQVPKSLLFPSHSILLGWREKHA